MRVVLVIAEDRGIREAVIAALGESSTVFALTNVEEAQRRMITAATDAIVLDDTQTLGLHALARLQKIAPRVPVIVLASRSDSETRASFILEGARTCLPKPFQCEALLAAIEQVSTVHPNRIPQAAAPAKPGGVSQPITVSRHQTALRWFNRITSHINNPEKLGELLADALTDVFDPTRCAVLMENHGVVRYAAGYGIPEEVKSSMRLDYSAGLMRWFEQYPSLADRGTISDPAAANEMGLLGAQMGLPLMCGGSVAGALLIGERSSGLDYTQEERELFAILARSASIALENAYRYGEAVNRQGRLDKVISELTSGIVVIAPDKTVSMMNESAERILQLPATEVTGRSVQKLGSTFADVVLRAMEGTEPLLRQELLDKSTGLMLGMSAAPLTGGGAVVIFTKLPLKSAEPASDEITYSPYWEYLSARVAQEVKNPLVAINTFAQLLPRKYDSSEFRHQFGEVVQQEVERINRVVEVLFEFARHPRLVAHRKNINTLMADVLSTFEQKFSVAGIKLITDYSPTDIEIELDPLYMAQAVHNVVQNAIDSMPKGGKLTVTTRRKEPNCEITIADTGPGIPAEVAPLVFLPFFGARETGMGLGLAIANRIAKQHDGTLHLAASQSGATFVFTIPLQGKMEASSADSALNREHATTGMSHENRLSH